MGGERKGFKWRKVPFYSAHTALSFLQQGHKNVYGETEIDGIERNGLVWALTASDRNKTSTEG